MFSDENHPQGTELAIETFKQVDLRRRKILTLRKTVIKVRTRISSSRKLTNQIIHNKVKKKNLIWKQYQKKKSNEINFISNHLSYFGSE